MKAFYSVMAEGPTEAAGAAAPALVADPHISRARVAVYDGPLIAPRVEDVWAEEPSEYIELLSARVYRLVHEQGGDIPYTVIREVSENFIHAHFAEPVVSIMDKGSTVRFADQGPGIPDKDKALLPGFTTADADMKRHIRGVGSGLPIVREYLLASGGSLLVEDNLGSGAVITISANPLEPKTEGPTPPEAMRPSASRPHTQRQQGSPGGTLPLPEEELELPVARPRLSTRQKQVLALVMETGSAGPSLVSRELGVGISTAYRDLASLEDIDLISSDGGKRRLTEAGMSYLDELMSGS